jgi:hypothetical protein
VRTVSASAATRPPRPSAAGVVDMQLEVGGAGVVGGPAGEVADPGASPHSPLHRVAISPIRPRPEGEAGRGAGGLPSDPEPLQGAPEVNDSQYAARMGAVRPSRIPRPPRRAPAVVAGRPDAAVDVEHATPVAALAASPESGTGDDAASPAELADMEAEAAAEAARAQRKALRAQHAAFLKQA